MRKTFWGSVVISLALALCLSSAALADVYWTDWTSKSTNQVNGVLLFGSSTVNVTFNGDYNFAQLSGGTNYWNPSAPYISATVPNAPPASDIIGLSNGGTVTINFSQAVVNPLLALVSWNGNVVDFGVPINILSSGPGYWGTGSFILNGAGTGFTGSGEVHGVIELPGTFTSISFTHLGEDWHGLTVGARDFVAPLAPSVYFLGSGLLGLVALRRKFRG